jgi:hypothetical protein
MSAAKAVVTVESAIAPATKDFVKNAFIYVPYSMTHDATKRTLPSLYESFVTSWDILNYSFYKNKSIKSDTYILKSKSAQVKHALKRACL